MNDLALPLPCFACGKDLLCIWGDGSFQPDDAVTFSSPGNYGSTVFDEMDDSRLMINICDECLRTHAQRTALSTPIRTPKPDPILSRWAPPAVEQEEVDD
jgi:hypothetical protein